MDRFSPKVLHVWFSFSVFHRIRRFFSRITRPSNVLHSAKFVSKIEENYNNVSYLNILLITRLSLISSHLMYTLTNNTYTNWFDDHFMLLNNLLSSTLQVHYYQPRKFIGSIAFAYQLKFLMVSLSYVIPGMCKKLLIYV